jgi:hypothetical protein
VTLDDRGYAKVEDLPVADTYDIEMPEMTLAFSDQAAPHDEALA